MRLTTKKRLLLGMLVLSLLNLQGCALQLLDWATPKAGYQLTQDIAYGGNDRHRLDVYEPDGANRRNVTIVFFYGGAWEDGDKDKYRFVAQAFAQQGYRVVVPDYRVYPEVLFPGFMYDAAQALAWTSNNTDQPIVVMGHSAGAHIAALVTLDNQYLNKFNVDPSRIAGLVGLSGPYDFLPLKSKRLKTIFSGAEDIEYTQPVNYVTSSAPPTLLIHGLNDLTVYPFNSENLAKKLEANNVDVDLKLYPDASHAVTVGALSVRLRGQAPSFNDIINFLEAL